MSTCTPSYASEIIPINKVDCGSECDGVSFAVESMTSSTDSSGKCTFSWTVRRTETNPSGSTNLTGTSTLGCPSVEEVIFYCDENEECPAFKLILKCQ